MLAVAVLAAGVGSRMITVDGATLLQPLLSAVQRMAPVQTVLVQTNAAREWLVQDRLGLRPWALQTPEQVKIWTPDNTHHTRDLDTPEDLACLSHDTGQHWALPQAGARTQQN